MATVKYTIDSLEKLNSTDLRKAGTELGIKSSSKYQKDELLKLCQEAVQSQTKVTPTVKNDMSEEPIKKEKIDKPKTVKEPKVPKEPKVKMTRQSRIEYAEVTDEMQTVIDDKGTKISEKMKSLFALGVPLAQITKMLDTHYSFVRGTIQREARVELFNKFQENYEHLVVEKSKSALDLNKVNAKAIEQHVKKFGKFTPSITDLEELVQSKVKIISDEEMLNAYVGQLENPHWA